MTGTGLSLGNHTSFFFDRNLKTSPLDPVANTDTKLLILWSVSKGRVLAQDEVKGWIGVLMTEDSSFQLKSPGNPVRFSTRPD